MEKTKVIDLLEGADYRFAKSAKSRNPHWYTLKDTWNEKKDFEDVVMFIRENGKEERFWNIKYICYHYKGWKWWTMGADISETILINKTFVSEQYNKIAYIYDDLFKDEKYLEENKKIQEMLIPHLYNVDILDIGSGTGLLLDMFSLNPENYIGIDPSYGMIKRSREKYPHHKFKVDKLETFNGNVGIAVSLYGCMNYVLPDYLSRVYDISSKHFLMFYKKNYKPITYEIANVEFYHNQYTKKDLQNIYKKSQIKIWNNYYIVSNL